MTRDHAVENARNEMAKALRSLQEARSLASLDMWDGAVSRAYYAAFHAARALPVAGGHDAKSHAGVHELFFRECVATKKVDKRLAKDLASLQRFREQADYGTSIRFDEDTGREEVDRAAAFVDAMRAALAVDGIVVDR